MSQLSQTAEPNPWTVSNVAQYYRLLVNWASYVLKVLRVVLQKPLHPGNNDQSFWFVGVCLLSMGNMLLVSLDTREITKSCHVLGVELVVLIVCA